MKSKTYHNPIRDAILELVVGDALGVPVEFKSREEMKKYPVKGMIGFGTHHQPPGTWSDDSALALCLAEALTGGYDLGRIGESFVAWLYDSHWTPHGVVFDVGLTTREAIQRIKQGTPPHVAGDWDVYANGNGALMRILPLLFYIKDLKPTERYRITREVACITHGHVRSSLACFYYLELAKALCEGEGKNKAYAVANAVLQEITTTLKINPEEVGHFDRLLDGKIQALKEPDIQSSGYVMHTLEAAVWCLLTTGSYREAVLKAVNLGEDTDTTGAVTGGLAGLLYGAAQIPPSWLATIARLSAIQGVIAGLTEKYKEGSR